MDRPSYAPWPMPLRLLCACLLALLCAGCGGSDPDLGDGRATLVLDFQPNAVHTGIYTTVARDFDSGEDVELTVRAPGASTDSVRLLLSDRIDFAVLDIHDLALARAKGSDVVGVMGLVQTPLAAVVAAGDVRRPRDLEGKRVGVSGLPSDTAVLDSIVRGDGGDPAKVRRTTIGFTAVPSLLGGKVDAVVCFWNAEGVALREQRPSVREFRVERFGAPAYPELVLATSRAMVDDRPDLVRAVVRSLRRGYDEALADPEAGLQAVLEAAEGLERPALQAQLDAVSPSFTAGVPRFGVLDVARLRDWARWEQQFGIVEQAPDVRRAFAADLSE